MTLEDLVARDRPRLVNYARKCGAGNDAEDVVRCALIVAHRRRDASESETGAGWLYVAVRHLAYEQAGRRCETVEWGALVSHLVASASRDWQDDLLAALDVRAGLAGLKADERRALLHRMIGHSYLEIARHEDWSPTKVNRCVSEGRAALRSALAA